MIPEIKMETKSGIITAILFKGQFGFIRQEDGSDIFFHRAGVLKPEFNELREGMPVDYLATTSPKGSRYWSSCDIKDQIGKRLPI